MEFLHVNVYYTGCPVPNPSANPKLPSTNLRVIQRAMTQQCLCDLKQCLTQLGISLPIIKQGLLEVGGEFQMYPRVRNKTFKVKKDKTKVCEVISVIFQSKMVAQHNGGIQAARLFIFQSSGNQMNQMSIFFQYDQRFKIISCCFLKPWS